MRNRMFACCHARKTAVANWLISGWPDIKQWCAAPRFQTCLRGSESGIYSAASINARPHEGKPFIPRELPGSAQLGACIAATLAQSELGVNRIDNVYHQRRVDKGLGEQLRHDYKPRALYHRGGGGAIPCATDQAKGSSRGRARLWRQAGQCPQPPRVPHSQRSGDPAAARRHQTAVKFAPGTKVLSPWKL